MVGILLFYLSIVFGWLLVRKVPLRLFWAEALAASVAVGLLAVAWIFFLPMLAFGISLGIAIGWALLAIGAFSLLFFKRGSAAQLYYKFETRLQTIAWTVQFGFWAFLLTYLFQSHMMFPLENGWHSAGGAWGDLGLHMSLISHFAHQTGRLALDMPVYAGEKLTYPFLIDFYSSLLLRGGMSWQSALGVPGLALALAAAQLVFSLSYALFKRVRSAILASILFFVNGSFWGIASFWKDMQASGLGFWQFATTTTTDYAHLYDRGFLFTNTITTLLLPQRGFLMALPLFCLVVIMFHAAWQDEKREWLLMAVGVVLGLLPFVHVHTFFVAGFCFFWLVLARSWERRRLWLPGAYCLLLAGTLASPQVAWQFLGSYHKGFTTVHLGWGYTDGSLLAYLFQVWGPALAAAIILPIVLWKSKKDRFALHLVLAFLVVGIASHLLLFQPHAFDNIKFLIYVYFGIVLVASWKLLEWAGNMLLRQLAVGVLCLAWSATGVTSIIQESSSSFIFLAPEDIAFARALNEKIPQDATVLTSDRHNHPVPTLTGRKIVMGYRGWLWTYGIDYRERETDVAAMFMGASDLGALFRKYGISYVVIGAPEIADFYANRAYYEQSYPLVLKYGTWEVFRVGD